MAGIFDVEKALDQAGGDKNLLKEVMNIFVADYPKQLQEIEDALNKNDADTAAKVAHTIKGAVSNFAAGPAFEAALGLEQSGKNKDLVRAKEIFSLLKKEIKRLAEEFDKYSAE